MGVSCSCPFEVYSDFENGLDSLVEKSNALRDGQQKSHFRSISIKDKDSGKLLLEGSIRFRSRIIQTMRFAEVQSENKCMCQEMVGPLPSHSPVLDQSSPKHEAALKLQKVYKSFRTRRKLADCAVLIEQSWWKLLDFAELKHSSISFFDLDKQETAISRWSRARTRAAKVGKGLSKNGKAQKLALQHWLEAIDPRHRYGHNLHFYYVKWLNSQSKEPFFYWLDIGEGKEVNIIEKCPRLKLQQQCIKYLGPIERKAYEIAVVDGKLFYNQTGELLNTINEPKGSKTKWIFVLSTSGTLYVGKKRKGSFQHSSFLAGGATLAAGRIVAEKGVLKAVWPHSGHYRPTPENFQDFISFLRENEVDLTNVKLDPIDDEDDKLNVNKGGVYLRSNSSEDDLTGKDCLVTEENFTEDSSSNKANTGDEATVAGIEMPSSRIFHGFIGKLTTLLIPSKDDLLESLKNENKRTESNTSSVPLVSPMDGYETEQESFPLEPSSIEKNNMVEGHNEANEETIPEESILQRINSHKEMISYQLGKQLSCKWSTGAGPRIGCLRDYPSGLQSHALEQVNLSPRTKHRLRLDFPLRTSAPTSSNLSHSVKAQSAPIKDLVAVSSF